MNKNSDKAQIPTETNHYAWIQAWSKIEEAVQEINTIPLSRAWVLCQRIIDAQASLYSEHVGERVAIAMAWEDLEMGFRGIGQPGISGAVFHLWSRVPDNCDAYFHSMLTEGFYDAVVATDPTVLRYASKYHKIDIATLTSGFGKGEVDATDIDRWDETDPPTGCWNPHLTEDPGTLASAKTKKGEPTRLALLVGGKSGPVVQPSPVATLTPSR